MVHQLDTQRQRLEEIAGRMTKAVLDGNKILWCGNGGSATAHNIWRQSRWDVIAATAPAGLRLSLPKMVP